MKRTQRTIQKSIAVLTALIIALTMYMPLAAYADVDVQEQGAETAAVSETVQQSDSDNGSEEADGGSDEDVDADISVEADADSNGDVDADSIEEADADSTDAQPEDSDTEADVTDADADAETAGDEAVTDADETADDAEEDVFEGTLINTDTPYCVKVTIEEDAKIPEGAELTVSEKDEADYLDNAKEALDADDVSQAVFLDISIVKDGEEIQPSADVKVEVIMEDILSDDEGEMAVVHFKDENSDKVETVKCDTDDTAVSFDADGFSVYGFLYAARAEVLATGYGNYDHTVVWEMTEENDRRVLTFKTTDTAVTDKEKAIIRVLDSTGTIISNDFRDSIKEIRIEEGITGIGWTAIENRNSYQPQWPSDYPEDSSGNTTRTFQDFRSLDTVKTCSTIKRIGWSAFRKCKNLTSIDFNTMVNLEEIMNQAFSPSALKTVNLSACTKLKTIGHGAFNFDGNAASMQTYESVILPASLETIGSNAFYHSRHLKYVTFVDISNVKNVYKEAFMGIGDNYPQVEYIADEKTGQKAVLKVAARDLFSGVTNFPNSAFDFTKLGTDNYWPLDITVKGKTTDYNGSEQKGYEVSNVTEGENETCTVSGLQENHVLSVTEQGYEPSSGTNAGEYNNGSFTAPTGPSDKHNKYEIMYDGYNYAINYKYTTSPGKLEIEKAPLTIAMADRTLTYNGSTQYGWSRDDEGKETITGLKKNSHTVTIDYSPSSGENYGTYNNGSYDTSTLSVKDGTTDVTNNYKVESATAGKLTIEKAPLTIAMADRARKYNGSTQYGWSRDDEGKETIIGLKKNSHTVTIDYTPSSGKNAATYDNGSYDTSTLSVKDGATDVTNNYKVESATAGKLTIGKAPLKITMSDRTLTYNGETQYGWERYDEGMEQIDGLVDGQTLKIDYIPSEGKNATTYDNGSYDTSTLSVKDGTTDVTNNYELKSATAGKLTIGKASLKITATDQKHTYNGEPQGEDNATYTDAGQIGGKVTADGLQGSDAITSITLNGQETNAGEYAGKITASDAEVGNATDNYNISYVAGKLTIEKAKLIIAVNSQTYSYNGEPQGEDNATYTDAGQISSKVTADGLQGSDALTSIKLNGRATNAGEYPGKIAASRAKVGNATDNYSITYNAGKLTINPVDVNVTITGHKDTKQYNSRERSVSGYDFSADNSLYKKSDFSFSGTAKAARTNVGTTDMGLSANQFVNKNSNFGNVTFNVTDGSIEVTKRGLKITTGSATKRYDGSALTNSDYDVKGLASGDSITVETTGARTAVGSSDNTYTIDWGSTRESNYKLTDELGTLTVTSANNPAPVNPDGGNVPGDGLPTADIDDGETPMDDGEDIDDDPVPKQDKPTDSSWALLNLIFTLLTVLLALFALFMDRGAAEGIRGRKIICIALAVLSVIVLILTEPFTQPMHIVDKWTLLMALILAAEAAAAFLMNLIRNYDQE